MKITFISFLTVIMSLNSYARDYIELRSSCSHLPVSYLANEDYYLFILTDRFDDRFDLDIKMELFPRSLSKQNLYHPVFVTSKTIKAKSLRSQRLVSNNFVTNMTFPSFKKLESWEMIYDALPMWTIRVTWRQHQVHSIHTRSISFYRIEETHDVFELMSLPLCLYQTDLKVNSKLYTNHYQSLMSIKREYFYNKFETSNKGLTFGPNNIVENNPFVTNGQIGWLFKDWSNMQGAQAYSHIIRSWQLNSQQSAVIGERKIFSRYKTRRWVWSEDKRGCYAYQPKELGYLDVGKAQEDFYILPAHLYTTDEMLSYIEGYSERIDTCKELFGQPLNLKTSLVNSNNTIYNFYSLGE